MSETAFTRKSSSCGISPRSAISPMCEQIILRKYSWRENDKILRESVVIPINLESNPKLSSDFK